MILGIPHERFPGERRVAVAPAAFAALKKLNLDVIIESGAGASAGFTDEHYTEAGAEIVRDRAEIFRRADIIAQVRTFGADSEHGRADLSHVKPEQIIVGLMEPMTDKAVIEELAETGVTGFALELVPRITRAQAMDVLSSQANIGGYMAVIIAAEKLPKLFPMMMTAAGTIQPAKVFVIGAGVAGLQAIATARRLGAVVQAFDIRPAVKEQIESLGASFLEVEVETAQAEDKGGYAKEMSQDALDLQKQAMSNAVANADVVITTAAVPGRAAPKLVTAEMVRRMKPGSVIVDLAAERGGNCELTQPNEIIDSGGVTIVGITNLPGMAARDASQMYARNIAAFLKLIVQDGALNIDTSDEIVAGTLLVRDRQIAHPRVREIFGLQPLQAAAQTAEGEQS